MAAVRKPTAPSLTINVKGASGVKAPVVIYQSDYTPIAWDDVTPATSPLYLLLGTLKTLIEGLSLGVVAEYKYQVGYLEGAAGAADPVADVGELGVFEFNAQDGTTITVSIPAIDPAVLVPTGLGTTAGTTSVAMSSGRQLIDVGNAAVVAFVQFMLTGANGFVPGSNRIIGTTTPIAVNLQSAYTVQRPSPMVMRRQGI